MNIYKKKSKPLVSDIQKCIKIKNHTYRKALQPKKLISHIPIIKKNYKKHLLCANF